MTSRSRKRLLTAVQWGLTIVAFWYVARTVSWRNTLQLLVDIDPLILLAVGGVTVLEFGARFSQWWILLNALESTPLSTVIRIDLVIKFINHIIPSKVSGHSIAPVVVRHYTEIAWTEAVTISGLKTGLYATLYGLVALCGLGLFLARLPGGLTVVILLSTGLYAVVGVLVLFAGRRLELAGVLFARLERVAARVPRIGSQLAGLVGKLPTFTEDSAALFRDLSARPNVVVPYALAWAGTLMVFPGIRVGLLLTGLGGSFTPIWLLPVVLVMAYSVTVLPLTPGGVGVAEASATLVFVSLGVSEELAIAVVLVDRVFGVYLPALLGAIPMADLDLATLLSSEQ
ncbi:MAG: lysylphosphatidylglycerol synthase transmembrane domain-containing protein [Haloarculaceae archaeon]